MNRVLTHAVLAVLLVGAVPAAMAEGVSINGFLTTSVVQLDTKEKVDANGNPIIYNRAFGDEARFDNPDSRLGLQFSGAINSYMDATAQLIAHGRGGNETISTDWAFVSLKANPVTSIRTGKLKFSTFLISDYIEVGYAYPWIRPPAEVYSLNPISTLVGADLLYTPTIGNSRWTIQPYYGSNRSSDYIGPALRDDMLANPGNYGLPGTISADDPLFTQPVSYSIGSIGGVNLVANFDVFSFRLGYLNAEVTQADFGMDGEEAEFASAGLTMDWNNVVAYAEYASRNEAPALETAFPDQTASYVTLGYRIGKFLPHITHATIDYGEDESPLAVRQSSSTFGVRYEFLDGAALKFEAQKIEPEQGEYGLFSTNTVEDAMLYGIALDVIF